ncbi:class I SAM-dependent methyltransferase [Niallia alba]|uniref:Methyltransferase domain-containing protein n=1 Tax=Niallia alba TaxID=2729105 RepID=A0A7Y0K836_9BACI|nr:class I SAM-dependent methyltransferase [Niallia alba]NMO77579.1 methyltransferase domain-containing protein [Niallia alba]
MESSQNAKDNWNADLYDDKHSFVSKFGNNLIELLNPTQGEKILDLGCGTGDLTNTIHSFGAETLGIDKSENMVKQAHNKYPHLKFMVQDATSLHFPSEFDAVFSNATLHWVHPPIQALEGIYQSLKKGGKFIAEFGGKGNVQTITNEIIRQIKQAGFPFSEEQFPWFYPSIGEYSHLMEKVGFRVTFAQHFVRPTPLDGDNGLRNWIAMFGDQLFHDIPLDDKNDIISKVEENVKDILYIKGKWMADYKRLRVIGVKE